LGATFATLFNRNLWIMRVLIVAVVASKCYKLEHAVIFWMKK